MVFAIPAGQKLKLKDKEMGYKYLDLAWELKKTMKLVSDGDTNCNWHTCYSPQRISTRTGGFGNKRTSWDRPIYCIIEIGQNIEKNPGDLSRPAVTQSSVEN